MKKKYIIEFKYSNGDTEEVTLVTDNIQWSIEQWCRNRSVIDHKILKEQNQNNKQMLFG